MANRRRRNTTGADDIAQAIHRMVDAMQPITAPPKAIVAPTRPVSMEDFMKHRPTKFSGKALLTRQTLGCGSVRRFVECWHARMLKSCHLLHSFWWQMRSTGGRGCSS